MWGVCLHGVRSAQLGQGSPSEMVGTKEWRCWWPRSMITSTVEIRSHSSVTGAWRQGGLVCGRWCPIAQWKCLSTWLDRASTGYRKAHQSYCSQQPTRAAGPNSFVTGLVSWVGTPPWPWPCSAGAAAAVYCCPAGGLVAVPGQGGCDRAPQVGGWLCWVTKSPAVVLICYLPQLGVTVP